MWCNHNESFCEGIFRNVVHIYVNVDDKWCPLTTKNDQNPSTFYTTLEANKRNCTFLYNLTLASCR